MPAIGASGILGIAPETVSGTYVAPTKYFPFDSESLKWSQENQERRAIRNTPSLIGMIRGNGSVAGDITLDCTPDMLAHFLMASRYSVVKTGASAPFTYAFTPAAVAVPTKTISITVKRGNETSGYTGCVVGGFSLTTDNGALKVTLNILGNSEATQTNPTPTWPTTLPFGAGMYTLEIPTGTAVKDSDSFEFAVEDGAEAQFRLQNTLGAAFIKFGENSATLKVERDFETRAELDQYKAMTSKSISFKAVQGADEISIVAPVAFIQSYDYNLSSVGDLVRASVEYALAINASGVNNTLTVKTAENITVV